MAISWHSRQSFEYFYFQSGKLGHLNVKMTKKGQNLANLGPKKGIFWGKPDFKNGLKRAEVGPGRTVSHFHIKIQ